MGRPARGRGGRLRRRRPGSRASFRPAPGRAPPASSRRTAAGGHRKALHPPGRRLGRRRPRRAPGRRNRDGQRKDPCLQPPGPRRAGAGAQEPRAVPLSDEGARTGSGAGAHRAQAPRHQARDLRRGHRVEPPLADPEMVEPDPHQPGHAPHRRAAPPRPLGRRAAQPPLRRGGRGARLPRSLRLARRQRASPPAPARPDLRRRPAVPPRLRDDREPGRARSATASGSMRP